MTAAPQSPGADYAPAYFAATNGNERKPLRILLWLLLTAVFCLAGFLAVGLPAGILAPDIAGSMSGGGALPEGPGRLRQETVFMAIVSASLAVAAIAALFAAKIAFKRSIASFITPAAPFRPRLLVLGFVIFGALAAVAIGLDPLITGDPFAPPVLDTTYPLADRAIYAVAALAFLLIAAGSEELLFRGILLSASAAWMRNAVLLALLNGFLFSAIHLDFDPVSFLSRMAMGAAFSWTVLALGGLEFAIGAHTANNVMLSWFAGTLSEAADISQTPPPIYALIDTALCVAMIGFVIMIRKKGVFTSLQTASGLPRAAPSVHQA